MRSKAIYETLVISEQEVVILRKRIQKLTGRGMQDAMGISWDTWNKISKGEPIKAKTRHNIINNIARRDINIHG